MRQVRVPIGALGLVALGLAVTATTAEAQNQGPKLAQWGKAWAQSARKRPREMHPTKESPAIPAI